MNVKAKFPIFSKQANLVYIDNAATTQKPQVVIDSIVEFYENYCSNVHRGLYPISATATDKYEEARLKIAKFINASDKEIIFTSGTTAGINSIARSLADSGLVGPNPKVLISKLEHHSNLIPWQQLKNVELSYINLDSNFEFDLNSIEEHDFDIIAVSLVSNVTGSINDIKKLRQRFPNALIVVDAAQAAGHIQIDVKALDVDFLVFSSHKIYGPGGTGVIFGKHEHLEKMQPFNVGGGMINEVSKTSSTWTNIPHKFEAGTPNIEGAIGMGVAIDFISELGWANITKHEQELRNYALGKLQNIESIKIFHPNLDTQAAGIISFNIEGIHPHDIAQSLGDQGVCIRAGHHCTQILHKEVLQVSSTARLSFGVYNNLEDVDKFIEQLNFTIKNFS